MRCFKRKISFVGNFPMVSGGGQGQAVVAAPEAARDNYGQLVAAARSMEDFPLMDSCTSHSWKNSMGTGMILLPA